MDGKRYFDVEVDFFGRLVKVDPELEKLLGYRRGELVGKYYMDIIAPDEKGRIMRYYMAVLKDKKYNLELKGHLVSRDGERHLFQGIPKFTFEEGIPVHAALKLFRMDEKEKEGAVGRT